jgi:hypothetical protein
MTAELSEGLRSESICKGEPVFDPADVVMSRVYFNKKLREAIGVLVQSEWSITSRHREGDPLVVDHFCRSLCGELEALINE